MFADVLNGNFQVTGLQWVGGAVGDPDILRRVYHSSQMPPVGFNRGRFSNPEVDRLIDLATVALTDEDRRHYYSAVQKLVAEEAVYIPIWSRINAVVARPGVTGVRINPVGDFQALAGGRKAVSP
jgi:peptide/nickel transport system substrate-binding protein